jgi:hypothetical protein
MSLRKSPVLTPALLAAARGNGRKSRGPRTARGKAQVRLNALRDGKRSRLRWDLLYAYLLAPPGQVAAVVQKLMTPEMIHNRVLREEAEIALRAEYEVGAEAEHLGTNRQASDARGDPRFCQTNRECL